MAAAGENCTTVGELPDTSGTICVSPLHCLVPKRSVGILSGSLGSSLSAHALSQLAER
jgi:hypothetical protein